MTPEGDSPGGHITRRRLLGAGAAGGLAVAGFGVGRATAPDPPDPEQSVVSFEGAHQAGIITPAQNRLHFAAFDLTTNRRSDLQQLLREWTAASRRMISGEMAGPVNGEPLLPPDDTGEALGLGPANLTITFGLGPGIFDRRFGLASKRPPQLEPLPPLPGDELDPNISGGDLCIQACADDPQVAFHAVRNLTRIASGMAVMRWCQLGFGRTAKTGAAQETPRNLMGFKDGTNNILNDDQQALDEFVWAGGEGPDWMRGGSYLVARRIRMLIEAWDRTFLQEQEEVIGRAKESGAPLGEAKEDDLVDLKATGSDGKPVIRQDAHIRQAAPSVNDGQKILRRGYSFTDGFDRVRGQLDAGLFFICFQRDPRKQFVPIQERLGKLDGLMEYIVHDGSGLFAVPPGVSEPDGFIGQGLFS
ncbi:MAG TPA: iron uptake transporter deferrochelatase/peroxidase subunit [Solirubrobacterales bacterium]|nr:iron uptake transporter deferrochelatase/peroxidase subunit [Solirubrobacterales bacterium]HNC92267.1 iron uptake transporter deferrochelatase/peroxidase subunit [Solirubrobacterales bacterium]